MSDPQMVLLTGGPMDSARVLRTLCGYRMLVPCGDGVASYVWAAPGEYVFEAPE